MRKPPVLMSTLSESDSRRADWRGRRGKEDERWRGTATVVDNGDAVVLRRLVKGQSTLKQTASIPMDLCAGKPLQVWPKQLGVTALALNEIRLMCAGVCVHVANHPKTQNHLEEQ